MTMSEKAPGSGNNDLRNARWLSMLAVHRLRDMPTW